MKAKKSKGDGVFNPKNGIKAPNSKMKGTPKVSQKFASHPVKNTGSVQSVDIPKNQLEAFAGGHKKLSGSLLGELQNGAVPKMKNAFGQDADDVMSSNDKVVFSGKRSKK